MEELYVLGLGCIGRAPSMTLMPLVRLSTCLKQPFVETVDALYR